MRLGRSDGKPSRPGVFSDEERMSKECVPLLRFWSDWLHPLATSGVFLRASTASRSYGNFSRLLAKYVEMRTGFFEEASINFRLLPVI